MSITVKLRRGTTTQHSTFTGEEAEVTVDTTKDVVVVHDGVTVGGHPMAKASDLATVAFSGDYNDLSNLPTAGTVSSVDLSAPLGFSVSGNPVTTSGTLALSFASGYALPTTTKQSQWDTSYGWGNHASAGYLDSADIGVTVQGYNANTVIDASYVHTDNNYTTTEKSKLAAIAAGAEVNVNADWNSISGDAQILNKPTLGTAAATASTDYATAAQGTKADSALQPANIGVSIQGYDADLQAIGALVGTFGLLKKTATNTWSLDTNTYLTSYTETDPIYTASSWYTTTNNSSNWNTAYGWGNHASAGYLTSASIGTTAVSYTHLRAHETG
jgi:hypothetical protein